MMVLMSTKDATSSACSLTCILLLWSPVEANCDNSSIGNFVQVHPSHQHCLNSHLQLTSTDKFLCH
jgi:hypothetical protein